MVSTERQAKLNVERLNLELAERRAAKEILGTLSITGRQKLSLLIRAEPETAELVRALDRSVAEVSGILESVDVNEGGSAEPTGGVEPPVKPPTDASQLLLQARVQNIDYGRLLQLFGKLETSLPLLLVDSFVISDKTPGIELGLHWFYFPPPS